MEICGSDPLALHPIPGQKDTGYQFIFEQKANAWEARKSSLWWEMVMRPDRFKY